MDKIVLCAAETRPASPAAKRQAAPREFDWHCWLANAAVAVLAAAAVLLGWRRAAGVLIQPPPPLLLGATGLALAAVAAVAHRSIEVRRRESAGEDRFRGFKMGATVAVAVVGLALTFPNSGIGPLAIFWAILLGEELWSWRRSLRRQPPSDLPPVLPDRPAAPEAISAGPATLPLPETPASDVVVQQIVRTRTPDGHHRLSGWIRVPFDAGQRTANAHLAFCPPFATLPEMHVEQTAGPSARVKTGQILPHGARFDLKLDRVAAKPIDVCLEFSADTPAETIATPPLRGDG